MKNLLLIISVFILISCGKNNSSDNNGREGNPEVQCGAITKASSGSLCLPRFEVSILGNDLPKKLKVSLRFSTFLEDYYNECSERRSGQVTRSETGDVINFAFYGYGVTTKDLHWVITDMGENCDNDAIFFDAVITPSVQGNKVSLPLNN